MPARTEEAINADYKFYDENYKPMWKRGISRKIGESAFVQQKLPTYRLSWSPYKVCPFFLLMGALFTGMGVGIKKFADSVDEISITYTDCISIENPTQTCAEIIKPPKFSPNGMYPDANDTASCTCEVYFQLDTPFNGTVYMHYALTQFYQNHLKYYASRDENQLKGNLFDDDGNPRDPANTCEPLDKDSNGSIIYPCGLMANSMFTDEIAMDYHTDLEVPIHPLKDPTSTKKQVMRLKVPLNRTGIAWESYIDVKYENPTKFANESDPVWENFIKPYGWKKTLWQLDPSNNGSNNGVENEDFIVWMRAAAFPWFRKLYRIVNKNIHPFENGLPAGNYSLRITYNYDVSRFDGQKSIILTTTSIVAGKNRFLAIVYLATGSLCIFLAIVLFVVHKYATSSKQSLKQE